MSGIGTGEMDYEFGTVLKRADKWMKICGGDPLDPLRVIYLSPRGDGHFWGIALWPPKGSTRSCLTWKGVTGYWVEDDQWPEIFDEK